MKIEAEYGCSVDINPRLLGDPDGYMWLRLTDGGCNCTILLSPKAVKQLRKALKNGVSVPKS